MTVTHRPDALGTRHQQGWHPPAPSSSTRGAGCASSWRNS